MKGWFNPRKNRRRLSRIARLLSIGMVRTLSPVRALFLGQSSLIVVTGTGRRATEQISSVLRRAFPTIKETSLPHPWGWKNLLKKRVFLYDATALHNLPTLLDSAPRGWKTFFVVAIEDPATSLCLTHPSLPHEYVEGSDYGFENPDSPSPSLTSLGLLPRWDALETLRGRVGSDRLAQVLAVDIGKEPNAEARKIGAFLGLSSREPGPDEPRLATPNTAFLVKSDSERIASQLRLFPEMQKYWSLFHDRDEQDLPNNQAASVPAQGTIIGFYTPDAVYRTEAERLTKNLTSLGLDFTLAEVGADENWVRTTLLKPTWIANARRQMRGPLLYLDVDAFVHRNPWEYLLDGDCDLGAVYNDGYLNSATLFIADTEQAQQILDRWQALAEDRLAKDNGRLQQVAADSDQTALQAIVDKNQEVNNPEFRFRHLPQTMAYIFDNPQNQMVIGDIFIEQLQASRESRTENKRLAQRRLRVQELEQ